MYSLTRVSTFTAWQAITSGNHKRGQAITNRIEMPSTPQTVLKTRIQHQRALVDELEAVFGGSKSN